MDRSPPASSASLPPGPEAAPAALPRRRTRAQATVEFALIAPLLFVLALGIMEFGWLFRSHMTVHFATREGARAAAVMGGQASAVDREALAAISVTIATMPYDDILEASIFHADTTGACVPDPGSGQCKENAYVPGTSGTGWVPIGGRANNWPVSSRRDTEPTELLGVRIKFRHRFLINFLPGAVGEMIINDYSLMSIEPRYFPTPTPR
jgi:Flp pilus assembly protein TadG